MDIIQLTLTWDGWKKLALTCMQFTAPFNNMRTLKFKAQPTNGFFAAVNQVFDSSS